MSDNNPAPDPESRPVEFRGGGFAPTTVRWVGLGVFIVLIALAEAGTRMGVISALTLPRPSQVFATLADLYHSGMLWKHLWPSLSRLAVGSLLGAADSTLLPDASSNSTWRNTFNASSSENRFRVIYLPSKLSKILHKIWISYKGQGQLNYHYL